MPNESVPDVSLPAHEIPQAGAVIDETLDPPTPEAWAELRSLAHLMVDDMLDYVSTVRERPVWQPMPSDAKARLEQGVPRAAQPLREVYAEFTRDILPYPTGNIHPHFWGWVMGTGTPTAMLGELLTGAMNAHVAGYDQSAVIVERQVIRWLAELLGYPLSASGLLVSGGTAANLVGLTIARNARAGFDVRNAGLQSAQAPLLRVYASTETHSWAGRACELLGLGRDALQLVAVDGRRQIDLVALRADIRRDRAEGFRPICVIGTAGTVNTGATDDLEALADLCAEEQLWFHVDGAFGALAALAPGLRQQVAGMARADSLAFDLHKWGYVQYEVGCVLVRDEPTHRAAFATTAAYLNATGRGIAAEPLYFADLGLQLSRGFRALKVWLALKTDGADAWGRLIQQNVTHAQYLAAMVEAHDELDLLAPVPLNVVCFRYAPEDSEPATLDALNQEILCELQERGLAVPSGTTLRTGDRTCFALRVANTNHRSRREDFRQLIRDVVALGRELRGVGG